MTSLRRGLAVLLFALLPSLLYAQGVTTSSMSGIVTDRDGNPLADATVTAVHLPSNTSYRAIVRPGGAYTIPNMRIGGPYRVTVASIGFQPLAKDDIQLALGQVFRYDARLERQAVTIAELEITETRDQVLSAGRTGAATSIEYDRVLQAPSVKRTVKDLTRLDPRSDGGYSFAGRNWLFNSISVDGSYFNNSFGLDDPSPGGQTDAQPIPFDAIEQVQVAVAPFDVKYGGFTGASVNTVTRSGTNSFTASLYSFYRNKALQGNKISGSEVVADPDLSYLQSGISFSGPLIRDKLFFFVNGEIERTDNPGSDFVACSNNCGSPPFGVSRVSASTMDAIRQRLIDVYDYDPGPYQGYINETDNNKLLLKLDWNLNQNNNASFRYNYLDAGQDKPPHPFVLSFNNTGRGPNSASLPFRNSGYNMNNQLHSFAGELNSRGGSWANRFFASYNRFRDFRSPFSTPFPTVEIGENGVTYTTAGHEPFSINNILDQDVYQITDNLNLYRGRHTFTVGANYESFSFFNSFNIFRNGVFFLPYQVTVAGGSRFPSVAEFFAATDPNNPNRLDLNAYVGSGPYKGEKIGVSQYSLYGQDEFLISDRFTLTAGLRADVPTYRTTPVDNPFSRGLTALDEDGNPEVVDQSSLPGAKILWSPRIGFNWNAVGERRTQVRGGTGIFTGRVPFVWVGNVISNPGQNPNLYPISSEQIPTSDDAILQTSFDVNAMDPDFKWPQVWTTDLAIDQQLGQKTLLTLEAIYGKDLNAVFMRNADLAPATRSLPDGRPVYSGELNPDGGAGIYVIDNTREGHNLNLTAQIRTTFSPTLSASLSYSFNDAKNNLRSTEIASVLWQSQPIQRNPNNPELGTSEFGQRHRIVGTLFGTRNWSQNVRTQVGLVLEVAEGGVFTAAGGNRFSFIYSGDVNGDGQGGNDLIYIPRSQGEINFAGNAQAQWDALNAFIEQDPYLSKHRGEIAERMGGLNPWYHSLDLRILQDLGFGSGTKHHGFQLSLDVLNLTNLLNSDWGVRKTPNPLASSPLALDPLASQPGFPVFNFSGATETYSADLNPAYRWRVQIGLRYFIQ
jgi:hypothetical protein